ncbi:MAG: thioredoxin domain-containing protein [Halobacteriales archaeon]|nr:thioredoxin domain-containing protein [Halobacteriales archaeon]
MPNRLASERSAYLRSAAHQPIDWYPWGTEAFARAAREGKPVLLDIGAVWCHWCHVIDRESYDDPQLAKLINELFIPVKVDRDERPDVDARYQHAIQALTGQGGWPLTAFLTPDGHVFFGGTYFPPQDMYGRAGFRTVLTRVAEHWSEQREHAAAHAAQLHQELERAAGQRVPGDLRPDAVDAALRGLIARFDGVNGGFGGAPKFPHSSALDLAFLRSDDPAVRTVLAGTLRGMALGGIHDQLGGGFHRYSVDAEWVVPHFEKMLYDNAGLLRNHAQGWAVLREPLFREAAEGILRWVLGPMQDPAGGFFGSQDADVGLDDDGDYWTWTQAELAAAVPDLDLRDLLREHFDVEARGEMHHHPAKNVLFVSKPAAQLAQERGLPEAMVEEKLAQGEALLHAARMQRQAPLIDRSLYVSWNGMMCGALLDAARWLDRPDARDAALRALDRILREGVRDGRATHVLGGSVPGMLEDQVFLADALLRAHEATGDARWLRAARQLLDAVLAQHQAEDSLLTDTPRDAQPEVAALRSVRKPIEDAPTPSPTGVAAWSLDRLAALTDEPRYQQAAERILRGMAGSAEGMGALFAGSFLLALEQHVRGPVHVSIVGSGTQAEALHTGALRATDPLVLVSPPGAGQALPAAAKQALLAGTGKDSAVALVCRGHACSPPARSPEELARLLQA